MTSIKDDFPILKSCTEFETQNFLNEEIVSIYFLLHRNHNFEHIRTVYNKTIEVLAFLKKHKKNNSYTKHIDLLYRMIPQTRDIIYGKGEHDMAYLLILAFYTYEPSLSIFALHRLVSPIIPTSHYFGSWRDIKYFCLFVKDYSQEKENHPLISYAVELINNQLYSDIHIYKFSQNCFSKSHISNVAKWIPRERKNKFSWLYDKLALHWARLTKPYLFDNVTTLIQHQKVLNKSKKLYRKQFSFLNKELKTTEIFLTQKKFDLIKPNEVQLQTLAHENHLLDSSECIEKQACIDKIRTHLENTFQPQENFIYKHDFRNINHISLSYIVKQAFLAIQHNNNEPLTLINSLWKKMSILIPYYEKDFFIPVVDISLYSKKNNSESFYSSLALAILLSDNSNIQNRIIAMDAKPIWIQFEDTMTFTDKIKTFILSTQCGQNTTPDYLNVIELIFHALNNSKMSNYFIKNVNIVFFSSFYNQEIMQTFFNKYQKYFKLYEKLPIITFWNTSTENNTQLPILFNQNRYLYMSGFSTSVLKQFIKTNKKSLNKPKNPFEFVQHMCNLPYYDSFSHYLQLYI